MTKRSSLIYRQLATSLRFRVRRGARLGALAITGDVSGRADTLVVDLDIWRVAGEAARIRGRANGRAVWRVLALLGVGRRAD